jgi:hypothetical protein
MKDLLIVIIKNDSHMENKMVEIWEHHYYKNYKYNIKIEYNF